MPLPSKTVTTFFFSAVLLIFGLLWLAYFYFMLSPVAAAPIDINAVEPLTVEKGEGVAEIAAKLETSGLVRSGSMTKIYSFLSGNAHKLKPGLYTLSPASSTSEIVHQLVRGPSTEVSVLIKEGDALKDIDAKLAHLGIITRGELESFKITDELRGTYEFLKDTSRLEGYLFPDTYRFYFDSDVEVVVKAFLDNFKTRIDSSLFSDSESVNYDIIIVRLNVYSLKQILTLASMIEKEVPDSNERRLVSGIMYKRLKLGMALQIDAATDYAAIYGEQYDTYKYPGLPPGPISNPGLDAIDAALNPKNSNYLYYLSDPDTKETIFAETFEQHKANKEKYLR